jgi:hypothetical protein
MNNIKKVIRLTETDLVRIIKRVVSEDVNSDTISKKYVDFMNQNRDVHTIGAYIIAIEDCLESNGYKNTNMIPDTFKKIILKTNAFMNVSRSRGDDLDLMINLSDSKTRKLIECMNKTWLAKNNSAIMIR